MMQTICKLLSRVTAEMFYWFCFGILGGLALIVGSKVLHSL